MKIRTKGGWWYVCELRGACFITWVQGKDKEHAAEFNNDCKLVQMLEEQTGLYLEADPPIQDDTPKDWKNPDWGSTNLEMPHEWLNYIGKEVQAMWGQFTDEQKRALARQADKIAMREEWD